MEKKIINKETYKPMFEEIISSLHKRDDFPLIIDIYMNTIDDLAADCLRKHLILKKSKPKKIQEDNDSSNGYIKFGIYLSCLNDDDQYYHKFLKGILKYFKLCFENDYLYQYLQQYKNNSKNSELFVLQDLVQDYLKIEKSEKYIKVLEKSIPLKDTEIYSNSKDIQELKENINGLLITTNELEIKDKNKSKEINELKKKDEEKSKEIKELKKRVDFIEPIVISLICRKAINYCICKILDKYNQEFQSL